MRQPVRFLMLFFSLQLPFYLNCSQFNQPTKPFTGFEQETYDYRSGSSLCFSENGRTINLLVKWNLTQKNSVVNGKIYIRKRNENESIVNDLSDDEYNFRIDIRLGKLIADELEIVALYSIYDGDGQILKEMLTSTSGDRTISIPLDDVPIDFSLFFWQGYFQVENDTIRLPEMPGIWRFGLSYVE
jgi:hypothetical protein